MTNPPPELSRTVALDRIRDTEYAMHIMADADECNAIAGRLMEPAVESFVCDFVLHRPDASSRAGEIRAEGRLQARVRRECVVSLEVFASDIDERFRVSFVPEGSEIENEDPESDDEIPYSGATLDLGDAAVEQLALILDPYPRKPGAELPAELSEEPSGPFAALSKLARSPKADGEG